MKIKAKLISNKSNVSSSQDNNSKKTTGIEFVPYIAFQDDQSWTLAFLFDASEVLQELFVVPPERLPPAIDVKIDITASPVLSGSASYQKPPNHSRLTFRSNLWPKEKHRLWILTHELTNIYLAAGGSNCSPSDWWSNGRSPFPEFVSSIVLEKLGYKSEAEWRKSVNHGKNDYALFWKLYNEYGFKIYREYLSLVRKYDVNFCVLGDPWPSPSKERSLYSGALLSIAANTNLAPVLSNYGVGNEPDDWKQRHPEIEFREYKITSSDIEKTIERLTSGDISRKWIYCAKENAYCAFSGERNVRYGANGKYKEHTFVDGVSCNTAAFGGDPIVGIVKSCEVFQ
jgi:hypothetical protein